MVLETVYGQERYIEEEQAKEKKMEGGGVKERKYEREERGQVNYFIF